MTKNDALGLVLALRNSQNGSNNDAIIMTSDIKPDLTNKYVPRRASRLSLYLSNYTLLSFINNPYNLFFSFHVTLRLFRSLHHTLFSHDGGSVLVGQADHP